MSGDVYMELVTPKFTTPFCGFREVDRSEWTVGVGIFHPPTGLTSLRGPWQVAEGGPQMARAPAVPCARQGWPLARRSAARRSLSPRSGRCGAFGMQMYFVGTNFVGVDRN